MEFPLSADDQNCTVHTTGKHQQVIFTVKLLFASVGIVVNFIAIVMFLIFKSYILLIFRIVLYIMIANMLQVLMQVVELFPVVSKNDHNIVRPGSGWTSACRSFGFLDQVSVWMGHLSILWLVLYFLYLIKNKRRPKTKKVGRREIFGLAICFFFPFVFNWIPFSNDYYGFSGSWCWIKLTENVCNDSDIGVGLAYILSLYYVPLLFFVLINIIACFSIFALVWIQQKEKEVVFVVIYPLTYSLFFVIASISRLDSAYRIQHSEEQSYPLWIAHSVADPCCVIMPAMLAIFMLPFTRKVVRSAKAGGEMEPLNA